MNDNNGFSGALGILVLLVALGAMNGNGGGIFGGGGNTAAETAALVESNNTAKQVAANGAGIANILERVGGNVDATVRGFDNVGNAVRDLDTKLCQLGNNVSMGQRDIGDAIRDTACRTERAIDRNGDRVLAWLNDNRDREQQQKICQLEAEKSNYKQTDAIKAYIDEKLGCCKPACSPCGAGVENGILFQMLSQMQSLAASVATLASKTATTTAA